MREPFELVTGFDRAGPALDLKRMARFNPSVWKQTLFLLSWSGNKSAY